MKFKLMILLVLIASQAYSQLTTPADTSSDIRSRPGLLWKLKANGGIVGSPVIDNGIVFVGSLDSNLYAIDLHSGKIKWKLPTGGAIRSSVCVKQKHLYLLSTDGFLYRVTQDSGKIEGVFKTNTGYMGDSQRDYADYFTSTPVLADSTIYFGAGEYIYALSTTDGYLNWSYKTGDMVHTKPAILKNSLFAGSYDGNLYSIDIRTGNLIWKFKTTGNYNFPKGEVMGNPVVVSGMVFAGARDYNLYAVDTRGGYASWIKQFSYGWALPVTVNDSVVYVGTSDDRIIFAYDILSGKEIWRNSAGFNIMGGMAIGKQTGYFGTLAGKINGIDLKTGKIKWTIELDGYKTNRYFWLKPDDSYRDDIGKLIHNPLDILKMYGKLGGIFGTPAVEGDLLVVAGYDGWIYGYSGSVKSEKTDK